MIVPKVGSYRRGAAGHEEMFLYPEERMTRTRLWSVVSQAAEVGIFFAAAGALAAGMAALR